MNSNTTANQYSSMEYELIALKVILDSIDDIVNHETLQFLGGINSTTVMFPTSIHQKYFYILLADFLDKNTDIIMLRNEATCLNALHKISEEPSFSVDDSVINLRAALKEFQLWLNETVNRSIWAAALNQHLDIELTREEIIYIAGTISKHHSAHLTGIMKKISQKLISSSAPDVLRAIDDIYEDLHGNILNYHGSHIAEMLNNIRLAVYIYLQPEFQRSYLKTGDVSYTYDVPSEVSSELTKNYYWDIMNKMRLKPIVGNFEASDLLQRRY